MDIPVLTPGPTTRGSHEKYFLLISFKIGIRGGTTQAIIISSMVSVSTSLSRMNSLMSIQYSSEVRAHSVRIRQWVKSFSPANKPMTLLELPTSMASNTISHPSIETSCHKLSKNIRSRKNRIKPSADWQLVKHKH